MAVRVLLPTYNERENLEGMVDALAEVIDPATDSVLVIDDGSPDGTGDLAARLAEERTWVDVLHREQKHGLGAAYVAGFTQSLDEQYDLIVQMDADFSHDPGDVPRLIAPCLDGADLALGSRYVPGGSIVGWPRSRRVLSRGGSWYARTILGLPYSDLTGGFKCFTRRALEYVLDEPTASQGYAFQVEMTYRAARAGLDIVEVPIRFTDRLRGRSKMTLAIATEAAWRVPAIRLSGRSRAVREQEVGPALPSAPTSPPPTLESVQPETPVGASGADGGRDMEVGDERSGLRRL